MKLELAEKQAKADALRQSHLQTVRQRAGVEEEKTREIAFIQKLEEGNRKMEAKERDQDELARLAQRESKRQHRVAEKAAREAAVQQRRQQLEVERVHQLRERDAKRQERLDAVRKQQQRQSTGKSRVSPGRASGSGTAANGISLLSGPTPPGGVGGSSSAERMPDTGSRTNPIPSSTVSPNASLDLRNAATADPSSLPTPGATMPSVPSKKRARKAKKDDAPSLSSDHLAEMNVSGHAILVQAVDTSLDAAVLEQTLSPGEKGQKEKRPTCLSVCNPYPRKPDYLFPLKSHTIRLISGAKA